MLSRHFVWKHELIEWFGVKCDNFSSVRFFIAFSVKCLLFLASSAFSLMSQWLFLLILFSLFFYSSLFIDLSSSLHFTVELLGLSDPRVILCIVLPFLFAYIEGHHKHTPCIRSHVGPIVWLLLLWPTGNTYCRSASCLLYHNPYSRSTNCTKVILFFQNNYFPFLFLQIFFCCN